MSFRATESELRQRFLGLILISLVAIGFLIISRRYFSLSILHLFSRVATNETEKEISQIKINPKDGARDIVPIYIYFMKPDAVDNT